MAIARFRLYPTYCEPTWFENRTSPVEDIADARQYARRETERSTTYRWVVEDIDGVDASTLKPSLSLVGSPA